MILCDVLRTLPSGAPVSAGTEVKVYRQRDNALLATVTTDANGVFTFSTNGSPGVVRYEAVVGASAKVHSTQAVMPVSALDLSGVGNVLGTFLDGVVFDQMDDLAVVADGVSMEVAVGAGIAVVRGVIYHAPAPEVVAIPVVTTNPRIDVLAVRVWRDTSGPNVGRCELVRIEGSEAVTPVAPALTQTEALWDAPLAEIRVDKGVLGIATNKVTDKRQIAVPFLPPGYINRELLAPDISFGVPYVKDGHTTVVVENATRLNFQKGLKAVKHDDTEVGKTQADIDVDYGSSGTSEKVSRDDHEHNKPVMGAIHITPRDIASDVNNQTETTVTLPAVKCVCKVRAFLRVASTTGGAVDGLFWANIAGQTGAKSTFQSDGGVDSLLVAMNTYETSGGTSMKVSWGMSRNGSLKSTGGWLEWECFPVR